jgi:hypothetical protein
MIIIKVWGGLVYKYSTNGINHVSKKADHAGNGRRFYSGRVSAYSAWVRWDHVFIIGQLYRRDYWHMDWL